MPAANRGTGLPAKADRFTRQLGASAGKSNPTQSGITEESKFLGPDTGSERAAGIYSLIGTANLDEIDPEAHLRCVLGRIADHPIKRI